MSTASVCSKDCGNGNLEPAEFCDQGGGNVAAGDGCGPSCAIESGWVC